MEWVSKSATLAEAPFDPEPMWDSEEAGAYLKLEPEYVRKAAARGDIPGKKIGKYWRFIPSRLSEWRESG
jgi:excisionase family DNA binding protein